MAIEDLTDVEPGDAYTRPGDYKVWLVVSVCKFPTVTLRSVGYSHEPIEEIHAAIGSPVLAGLTKMEKETPK
jgi:hypothetical protein